MKKIFFILIFSCLSILSFSQNYTISGYVEDIQTGERIIGCVVKDASSNKFVTTTNSYGFFSLKTPKKDIKIAAMYMGYQPFESEFNLTKDTSITIELDLINKIGEIVVTTDRQTLQSTQMSKLEVPIKKIDKLPVIFGETDLLKTLQLMPGVQSGTEGANGIYVRGGGPDQNLILLDGVPLYNVSHLFGFFSVFNTDAIKNVELYKGGFPARYGGRLSSVIDVSMKDGNKKKFGGSVSVGLISTKLTLEGPIKKDKTTFIVSGRRTYIDVLAAPFVKLYAKKKNKSNGTNSGDTENYSGGYHFYDVNAKLSHRFTKNDRLFVSFYAGQDIAKMKNNSSYSVKGENIGTIESKESTNFNLKWGNIITAVKWNHTFTKNLFMNTTATYSRFHFGTGMITSWEEKTPESSTPYTENYDIKYNSGINDLAAMIDFDYLPSINHRIKFGASGIYHTFTPGIAKFKLEMSSPKVNFDTTFGSSTLHGTEAAAYIEDDINITKWFKINIGGRISLLQVRDTIFWNPEPRVSARFLINKDLSIKLSYAEMQQYLHFLTNNIGLPIDLWMPATDRVIPEKSRQAAAGISWLFNGKYKITAEGFYKKMNNLLEFEDGESIFNMPGQGDMGEVWENKVTQGSGYSYGAEIYFQKKYGKFTGWISYTYARTNRKFPDINNNKEYPYKYDRRHDFSIVAMYDLNDNVNFGMTWVFGSGMPMTLQQAEFVPLNVPAYSTASNQTTINGLPYYGGRNNYRLPAYHRLDFSVNLSKKKKHGTRTWSFGVYNTYNHKNPFYAKIMNKPEIVNSKVTHKTFLRVFSIFPIIPSVSYKFVW